MASYTPDQIVLTCEHGGREVPAEWADCFDGAGELLDSHWAWDAGSAQLAEMLGTCLAVTPVIATVTRLLVDLNRSPGHPHQFSRYTRPLPPQARERMVADYYLPHRRRVEEQVRQSIERNGRAVQLSVHTFTPVYEGEARRCDIALLYDPGRPAERALCAGWARALAAAHPHLVVRRNYPYRGVNDGLTKYLRTRFPDAAYQGIELEVSQRLFDEPRGNWGGLERSVADATRQFLIGKEDPRGNS